MRTKYNPNLKGVKFETVEEALARGVKVDTATPILSPQQVQTKLTELKQVAEQQVRIATGKAS